MSKKIMIVDDEPDVRMSVGQMLEASGYTVIEAENGTDCLNKLEEKIPDLVLLDIMMPGMNGWDVAAKIKEKPEWSNIPIVFLTAKGDEMSIGIGHLASEDYIVKPFDEQILQKKMKNLIELRRKLKDIYSKSIVLEPNKITINPVDETFLIKTLKLIEENIQSDHLNPELKSIDLMANRLYL